MKREDFLKDLIIKQFGSIRKFSDHIGIASSTITSMLSRGVGGTSVDTVINVCEALGISVEELQSIVDDNMSEKEPIKPTTIAAHLPDGVELTEEEQEQLDEYIQFILSRRKY